MIAINENDETEEIDVGHAHVQFSENLCPYDVRRGDAVRFNARVVEYRKRLHNVSGTGTTVEYRYGLAYPTGIEVLHRMPRCDEPAPVPAHRDTPGRSACGEVGDRPAAGPVALLLELRQFAERAGGWDHLLALAELLKR